MRTTPSETGVAVVGGGVVGLATALTLAAAGHEVAVVDLPLMTVPASAGNAATLADYGCVPLGNPDTLRKLPALLSAADSPFALRLTALPGSLPWLLRFLLAARDSRATRGATALASLLVEAIPAWRALAEETGTDDLLRAGGCLYVPVKPAGRLEAGWDWRIRERLGVAQQRVSAEEVARLEPSLPAMPAGGVFFPNAMYLTDPGELIARLRATAVRRGVRFEAVRVRGLSLREGGVTLDDGQGWRLHARHAVIAAGAWSRALAQVCGDRVPLTAERGYHVEFSEGAPALRRPVCAMELGLYATPLRGRLRIAGTVEFAGMGTTPTRSRLDNLVRGARRLFPALGPVTGEWLGLRPSLPDSLPVIGPASAGRQVSYAFGHGHLGLTLAAVTARRVAALIDGHPSAAALAPFSARRFGG